MNLFNNICGGCLHRRKQNVGTTALHVDDGYEARGQNHRHALLPSGRESEGYSAVASTSHPFIPIPNTYDNKQGQKRPTPGVMCIQRDKGTASSWALIADLRLLLVREAD